MSFEDVDFRFRFWRLLDCYIFSVWISGRVDVSFEKWYLNVVVKKYDVVLALNVGGSAYSMFNSIACFVFAVSSFTPIYNSHRSYVRALAFSCLAALLVYFSVQGLMGKRGFQISIKIRKPRFCTVSVSVTDPLPARCLDAIDASTSLIGALTRYTFFMYVELCTAILFP